MHERSSDPRDGLLICLGALKGAGLSPNHVIDIGAHKGDWSRLCKQIFPSAQITLVDPLDEVAADLKAFCTAFPNSQYIAAAVTDRSGSACLTIRTDLLEASTLTIERAHALSHGWPQRVVPSLRLDDLINTYGVPRPNILKIDAEGCELKILRGAEHVWQSCDVLFIEAAFLEDRPNMNNMVEEISYLFAKGFVPFDVTWAMRRSTDQVLFLCELAFVKADNPVRRWK